MSKSKQELLFDAQKFAITQAQFLNFYLANPHFLFSRLIPIPVPVGVPQISSSTSSTSLSQESTRTQTDSTTLNPASSEVEVDAAPLPLSLVSSSSAKASTKRKVPSQEGDGNKKRRTVNVVLEDYKNETHRVVTVEIYNRKKKKTEYPVEFEFHRLKDGALSSSYVSLFIEFNSSKLCVRHADCFMGRLRPNWSDHLKTLITEADYNKCVIKIGNILFLSLEDLALLRETISARLPTFADESLTSQFGIQLIELIKAYERDLARLVRSKTETVIREHMAKLIHASKQDLAPLVRTHTETAIREDVSSSSAVLASSEVTRSQSAPSSPVIGVLPDLPPAPGDIPSSPRVVNSFSFFSSAENPGEEIDFLSPHPL